MAYLNGKHLNIDENYGRFRSQGRKYSAEIRADLSLQGEAIFL